MKPLRVFIGYDPREAIAYNVLSHSILRHTSVPVSITPVALSQLGGIFHRERDPLQSTDFSFSRFLVPYLSDYSGVSLFMDCDMVVMDDIAKLFKEFDQDKAVQVVKRNHVPKEETKFLGAEQTKYQRKNWSSVMLFNNSKCRALTPGYVETATGLDLHQFRWTTDDQIGELPKGWNHLVGYDKPERSVSNAHFTIGGPYFEEYAGCEYSDEWFQEFEQSVRCDSRG